MSFINKIKSKSDPLLSCKLLRGACSTCQNAKDHYECNQ